MLQKLTRWLESRLPREARVDPARFGDEVALKTEWTPLKPGGANFRTRRLVQVSPHRLEFRSVRGILFFCWLLLLCGLGAVAAGLIQVSSPPRQDAVAPLLIGAALAAAGGSLLYFCAAPVVFDAQRGLFWKGRRSPDEAFNLREIKKAAKLGDVHALQLVREHVSDSDSSYTSYELNLVLKDGKRLNVVDHGDLPTLRGDAGTLSRFLERPLWDVAS